MKLSRLLEGVNVIKLFQTVYGAMVQTHDVEIGNVRYDSRKVVRDDLFIAIRGTASDGHRYIQDAIRQKAKALVVEDDAAVPDSLCMHEGVIKIVVADSRAALSKISANYFEHPSRRLSVIGVTGTNGKTTTTHLLSSVVNASKGRAGLIGTIEYTIGDEVFPATHTTPESYELQELLNKMANAGCTHAVMEVSSHALAQRRVDDVRFSAAVFTNLTLDHLDYHRTADEYFGAKRKLFEMLDTDAVAVTNLDSPKGKSMIEKCAANIVTYGIASQGDVYAENIRTTIQGASFDVVYRSERTPLTSRLIGSFNVSNILAAYACARSIGMEPEQVKKGIENVHGVKGRCESISSPGGWIAVVDYSHTPDALENVLNALREVKPGTGRVITVFGCGGDRDTTKRPLMGSIAEKLSERVIVTSDNPRSEDPEKIIDDIMSGIKMKSNVVRESDRKKAIITALDDARKGDIVLIAGKGHETYQIIGNNRLHFSDREVVEEFIVSSGKA